MTATWEIGFTSVGTIILASFFDIIRHSVKKDAICELHLTAKSKKECKLFVDRNNDKDGFRKKSLLRTHIQPE